MELSAKRALPPRPSLLACSLGDTKGLERAAQQLLTELAALELAASTWQCVPGDELHNRFMELVGRLRFLRESVIANYMLASPLGVQVYEASCDACSRCLPESQPEMLKSINGLMDCYTACDCTTLHTLSPAAPDKASEPLSPSTPSAQCHTPPTGSNITTPSLLSDHLPSHSASQGHGAGQSRRREEMVAAWLLFCSASDASLASRLRSAHVQQARETPPLRFVLCWLSAASRGDFYACLHAVHDAPTPLLQRLLTWRAVQVQDAAMHVLAAAYKTLPLHAALHMMALQPVPAPDSHQQARTDPYGDTPLQVQGEAVGQAEQQRTEERVCLLEAVLQRVASKGNRAAAQALCTLQGQTSGGGSQVAGLHLTFKA